MVEIRYCRKQLHSATNRGRLVVIEIGQRSDYPRAPFYIEIGGACWSMSAREASSLHPGARVTRYVERGNPKILFQCRLFGATADAPLAPDAEIILSVFSDDDLTGIEQFAAERYRFVGSDCDVFLAVLARLSDEVTDWRRAQSGGVQQLLIRPDWVFERKGWYGP